MTLASAHGTDIATWRPQRDLLNSGPEATEFVVESETDGTAFVRFGDDHHGRRPAAQTVFTATYRVGNGVAGNVGAAALAHIVTNQPHILACAIRCPPRVAWTRRASRPCGSALPMPFVPRNAP
jgi:hypothetical protein